MYIEHRDALIYMLSEAAELEHPGMNAGPSYRSGYMLPHTDAAWVLLLHERLVEVAGFLDATMAAHDRLGHLRPVVGALHDLAAMLAAQKPDLSQREVGLPPTWGVGAVGAA